MRERAFSRFPHETQALSKVVGIADLVAWQKKRSTFEEVAPSTVKKVLTGSGKASKNEVACSLEDKYVAGNFETDDESDALAVGIRWCILKKILVEN